jgi:hypothetical protein
MTQQLNRIPTLGASIRVDGFGGNVPPKGAVGNEYQRGRATAIVKSFFEVDKRFSTRTKFLNTEAVSRPNGA